MSAVTTFAGCGCTIFRDELSTDAASLSRSLASGLQSVEHPKAVSGMTAMLVLSPEHWAVFKRDGWSRYDTETGIIEAGKRPVRS